MSVDFTIAHYRLRAYPVVLDLGSCSFAQFCALARDRVPEGNFGCMITEVGISVLQTHVRGLVPGQISGVLNRVFNKTPGGPRRLITGHRNSDSLVMAISAVPSICWLQESELLHSADWAVQLLSLP